MVIGYWSFNMSARDESEEAGDPGEKMLGCVRWVLGLPMMGIGVLGIAYGLLGIVFGGIAVVMSGKYEDLLVMAGSSLALLLSGLVFGGVGYFMITFGRKKSSSEIDYP